jgi:hypothetical protein
MHRQLMHRADADLEPQLEASRRELGEARKQLTRMHVGRRQFVLSRGTSGGRSVSFNLLPLPPSTPDGRVSFRHRDGCPP